jgi:hypothetical protein
MSVENESLYERAAQEVRGLGLDRPCARLTHVGGLRGSQPRLLPAHRSRADTSPSQLAQPAKSCPAQSRRKAKEPPPGVSNRREQSEQVLATVETPRGAPDDSSANTIVRERAFGVGVRTPPAPTRGGAVQPAWRVARRDSRSTVCGCLSRHPRSRVAGRGSGAVYISNPVLAR